MNKELEEKGYVLIKGFVSKEVAAFITACVFEEKEKGNMHKNDNQVQNAHVSYNLQPIRMLHLLETEKVLSISHKQLVPTYCYTRIYYQGSELLPHIDRDACEYSITLHLQGSDPWEIYMGDTAVQLESGDAVLYKGCEIVHYRKPFQGEWYVQCFLHYVDQEGPKYAETQGEQMLPVCEATYIPCVTKWNIPISEGFMNISLPFTEQGDKYQKSMVINEKTNKDLQSFLTKELFHYIRSYMSENHLHLEYGSHDVLVLQNGPYEYQMNDVCTFYVTTLYVTHGEGSIYFKNFDKTFKLHTNDLLILPISYAYNCSIHGNCTILRSVLI